MFSVSSAGKISARRMEVLSRGFIRCTDKWQIRFILSKMAGIWTDEINYCWTVWNKNKNSKSSMDQRTTGQTTS